jgi:uncharacterized protein YchJ
MAVAPTFTDGHPLNRMALLHTFYTAFAQRDHALMGACYHPQARFSDPVFPELDAEGVRAMWKMLLSGDTDLCISFTVAHEDAQGGVVHWEAFYTFGKRKVHNRITSRFTFNEGLIHVQRDRFNFWRWSRQALGLSGLLMGWTPMLRRTVRNRAAARLHKAMALRSS